MQRISQWSRPRRVVASGAALGLGVATVAALLGPGVSLASSHREAPFIASQPQLDNTDVYAFVSPDKTGSVNLVANFIPFEEPNGGPNFYPFATDAHYDINIDNNGDAKPDITYRWTFTSHYKNPNTFLYNTDVVNHLTDPSLNFTQTYTLDRLTYNANGTVAQTQTVVANGTAAPSDVGKASMPSYATLRNEAITPTTNGGQTLAGQADDPFFLDLRVFDLLYGKNLSEVGHDTLAGYNVNTLVLQVPKTDLALKGDAGRNPVIGVWSDTQRPHVQVVSQTNGKGGIVQQSQYYSQVSRLGNPLVNEVVVPVGTKDKFNATTPDQDSQFAPAVSDPELAKDIQAIYGIQAPPTPRNDLVEIFLTGICKACGPIQADLNSQKLNQDATGFQPAEELRLNMNVTPLAPGGTGYSRLGVLGGDTAGFPNGRRLSDDVVDIALQAMEGAADPAICPTDSSGSAMRCNQAKSLGDGVNANDVAFGAAFPYVALPHDSSVNDPGGTQESASPAP